jgi:hypothetical protein
MTTYAPVRDAYQAWLKTADQLTLEVDDLTSLPVSHHSPWTSATTAADGLPAVHPNTNGDRRNPIPGSAAVASQEHDRR